MKAIAVPNQGLIGTFLALCILILAFAPADAAGAPIAVQDDERVLDERIANIPGPKRTVAVASFGAKSDFLFQYGLSDLGGGLAAMLTTALVESGQFIVVERPDLTVILAEQELGANGLTTSESAPRLGALIGAQLLITGNVTEFSEVESGSGFSFGLGGSVGIGLSPQKRKGVVGLDIRVTDATTGQVVFAYHVREKVKSRSFALDIAVSNFSIGGSDFSKTPLGKAARKAINTVVVEFAEEVAQREWSGQVVDFEFGEVAINSGSNAGIQAGDSFQIQRVTRVLTDPTTGQIIGQRKHEIGSIRITEVAENVAFGTFEGDYPPQRGDIVTHR